MGCCHVIVAVDVDGGQGSVPNGHAHFQSLSPLTPPFSTLRHECKVCVCKGVWSVQPNAPVLVNFKHLHQGGASSLVYKVDPTQLRHVLRVPPALTGTPLTYNTTAHSQHGKIASVLRSLRGLEGP